MKKVLGVPSFGSGPRLFVFLTLFFCFQSWAISRVGNSRIGSEELGFESVIPESFGYAGQDEETKRLELRSNFFVVFSPFPRRIGIRVQSFEMFFPTEDIQNPMDLEAFMELRETWNWESREALSPCARSFIAKMPESNFGLSLWGPNKGVVLVGEAFDFVAAAIDESLSAILLNEGACQWK